MLLGRRARRQTGRRGTRDEQAEIAYLTAVCCYSLSEIPAAQAEFAKALRLLDEADEPNDRLRLDIHQWRSRCYRRQRDWEAAREDIERALELCEATDDTRRRAEVNFQASLVAERLGRWVLARRYAETSRDLFDEVGDTVTKGRVLNNLAGLNHLLGDDEVAIAQLREAFAIFVDAHLEAEAGYVLSSLAEIHRERGELEEAEARRPPGARAPRGSSRPRPGDRDGAARPRASAPRAGRARPRPKTSSRPSTRAIRSTESVSHQARSWMTRGELELLRQNDAEAARLYREAATALQPPDDPLGSLTTRLLTAQAGRTVRPLPEEVVPVRTLLVVELLRPRRRAGPAPSSDRGMESPRSGDDTRPETSTKRESSGLADAASTPSPKGMRS